MKNELNNRRWNEIKTNDSWAIFKIMGEFVEGYEKMSRIGPCVSIFGSARTKPNTKYYTLAQEIAESIVNAGYGVITGGGPGIMEAGNKGAHLAEGTSVGLNIDLPFEQHDNPYIDSDKSLDFDYFFVRKVMFVKYSQGFVVMPGGFGTLDELFEAMTLIQTNKIEKAIDDIIEGNFQLSERSLLSITTSTEIDSINELNFALNEIAVSRKNTTSMITVETTLDDEYLTSYWADGLIVSTPTGSTGYSLSCGGPVIMPETDNLVLTPIAPHNLNARPLVISNNTKIKLKVSGREDNFLVSMDSRIATLSNETVVYIEKAPFKIKMIELKDESFLDTLRKKLLWGEDKRN